MTKTRAAQPDACRYDHVSRTTRHTVLRSGELKGQRPAFLSHHPAVLNTPSISRHFQPTASMSRAVALVALTLSVVASVSAGVLMPRANDGDTSDCLTRYAGTLAGSVNGTYKAFTLSTANQTAYTGRGESPLVVQFQKCNSLESLEGDNVTSEALIFGRVYIPHLKKCISITNQSKTVGPYYTTISSCSTGYAQRFRLNQNERPGAIEWVGNTDPDSGAQQGGCGLLGYKANALGLPTITHTNQQITLECNSTAPFFLVPEVN
ncbi:hypothetical protein EXIGLDRAFT_749370 [Exidia glandulosa HHB12029]|uniref:Uncharacterized protein n=1 Tax=Exidia glandulosa HHB12029 TaxID=1314781 RepID=A0A165I844_EXIGL|nr:hypothetical protein EXIGLDRAFT_749370 [Exidia glandulosa HHB12029]